MNGKITVSEREKQCLIFLVDRYREDDGERAYYMRGIEKETGLNHSQVRRSVRALVRKGLAIYVRGLMDEDGFCAGSGFSATEVGAKFIMPCKTCGERFADYDQEICSCCIYDKEKEVELKTKKEDEKRDC